MIDLLLDEMFSPAIAAALRDRGRAVESVAERVDLRAMTDADLFTWAAAARTWLLTENVKDFRPMLLAAIQAGTPTPGLLFTSSRAFPRTRKHLGPLIEAVHAWLEAGPPEHPLIEDWLEPATG